MKSIIGCVVLYLLLSGPCFSQKAPAKFGDVSIADLKMTTYDKDTSAVAVVLVDFGESYLDYVQDKGFRLVFERLRRIKILRKEGLEYADYSIETYHQNDNEEKLSNLKAVTYNLVNDKIVETKMKGESVFKEKEDKNHDVTKFTLPDVKEGSVIEYTYKIYSDFIFNFQGWQFQFGIPVVLSEYRARFPEYFYYDKYSQGYITFAVNEYKKAPGSIMLRYKEPIENGARAGGNQVHTEKLDFQEHRYRWVASDVPAFKAEPYLTTARDYISKINFELSHTQYPQQPVKRYMGTWEDINRYFAESSDFFGEIPGNGFLKKTVEEVTAGISNAEEKIALLHKYVRTNIAWNEYSTYYPRTPMRKVLDERKGSSAEINLLLGSMLEKAGFTVEPVLISTRDHGFIREHIPAAAQFNYVLVLLTHEGKEVLLDATEPLLPVQTLPERCLNGKGFVISKQGVRWVNINPSQKTKSIANFALKLHPDGHFEGNAVFEYTGYGALNQRKKYLKQGEESYLKEFKHGREWDIVKSEFEHLRDPGESFKQKYDLEITNHATEAGDILYVNPFLALQTKNNPFKLEKREYPVDFGYPLDEIYMVKIEIPDGYAVDELPQSKVFMLPQNAARFLYNINIVGNTVMLTSNFSVNRSLFTQIEYPDLREFFNQVVAKQAEQIVFKKKI